MNRSAKFLLVAALVAVVGMAFRVSWNALRDVARAIGADSTAATLYPFVIDGLMALALIATLVLAGKDRQFALKVLGGYTAASLVLNYVHGLVPALHQPGAGMVRLAHWDSAHYALVLIATSLPVGAIFFGSDLVAKVLHHRPTTETVRVLDGQEPAPDPHTRRGDAGGTAAPGAVRGGGAGADAAGRTPRVCRIRTGGPSAQRPCAGRGVRHERVMGTQADPRRPRRRRVLPPAPAGRRDRGRVMASLPVYR